MSGAMLRLDPVLGSFVIPVTVADSRLIIIVGGQMNHTHHNTQHAIVRIPVINNQMRQSYPRRRKDLTKLPFITCLWRVGRSSAICNSDSALGRAC